jgi:hypothetical protein
MDFRPGLMIWVSEVTVTDPLSSVIGHLSSVMESSQFSD